MIRDIQWDYQSCSCYICYKWLYFKVHLCPFLCCPQSAPSIIMTLFLLDWLADPLQKWSQLYNEQNLVYTTAFGIQTEEFNFNLIKVANVPLCCLRAVLQTTGNSRVVSVCSLHHLELISAALTPDESGCCRFSDMITDHKPLLGSPVLFSWSTVLLLILCPLNHPNKSVSRA